MRFSPSSLSTLRDCERCFWIEQTQKIKRPRGIFPSLPGGMDRVLKVYVDDNCLCMPPECADIEGAKPYDNRAVMTKWRNWRTAPMVQVGPDIILSGALDDALQFDDGSVAPWDFKTRGAPPKPGDSEKYYGLQMDIYDLLLAQGVGLKTQGKAYLTYFWPGSVSSHGAVKFNVETVVLTADGERARQFVLRAKEIIDGPMPAPAQTCEYCGFFEGLKSYHGARDRAEREHEAMKSVV